MAHLYKRRNKYWICYYVKGEKKRKIEYDLSIGSLHIASQLARHACA